MNLAITVALLAVVLVAAVVRPRGLPEAVVAVPVAAVCVLTGLVSPAAVGAEIAELGATVGFLAAILLLGRLADAAGVFAWLGGRLATATTGPVRLLQLVVAAAAVTTAVLSLDATVVLLTPVVLATAARLRLPPVAHVYATGRLANSASTLLPVSNLTNLLAFAASGLTFVGFTALMAGPWLVAIAVEYAVLRWWFRKELHADPVPTLVKPGSMPPACASEPAPRFALAVLAATLVGFGASSPLNIEPVWVAALGAVVLAVPALARRAITPVGVVAAADPLFCVFVLALGVVVAAVGAQGLTAGLAALLPTGTGLLALLAVAGIAAVLANVVNNLPATLVLLAALGPSPQAGLVLAVLLGVNIGPNLTYVGSLATLLWRTVLRRNAVQVDLGEFTKLGLITVPVALAGTTTALWLALTLTG